MRKIHDLFSNSKNKIGNRIPVQTPSIARRKNKERGRSVSTYGRRVQNTLRLQPIAENQSDNVYFAPPTSKRQKSNRLAHNLQLAVIENRPNAKKH